MYEPTGRHFPYLAFLWPAFAAASASEMAALAAKQLVNLAIGPASRSVQEPAWATPHAIAVELKTVRLRDFSAAADDVPDVPTLLCTPLALHSGAIADFADGHSLVVALRDAKLKRLFVTDWRTATADMRFYGIDDYLADLNVLVDQIGGPLNLVGLCQGGWMALVYAARFPQKIRKLVLAGAPVDIEAAPSALSALADTSPFEVFRELVRLGDGIVPGAKMLKFWAVESVAAEDVQRVLQTTEPIGSAGFARLEARFRDWYDWTVDLPGNYFLEVVDKLYKRNEIATGKFVALGQRIDLAAITVPTFLLAARDDELVATPQLFAVERLIGTAAADIRTAVVPCRHLGLFMGKTILKETWPEIVRWIGDPVSESAAAAPSGTPAHPVEYLQ